MLRSRADPPPDALCSAFYHVARVPLPWTHTDLGLCVDSRQVVYSETDMLKWRGQPPRIELQYDQQTSFLLRATFLLRREETRLTSQAVHDIFVEDLALAKVISAAQSKDLMRNYAHVDHDEET